MLNYINDDSFPKPRQHQVLIPEMLQMVLRDHLESSLFQGPEVFLFHKDDGSPLDPDVFRSAVLNRHCGNWGSPFFVAPVDSICSVTLRRR